ncbi:hypothetical protein FACS189459_2660 [Bacilli bacterium]|nr:hypothetical protein FACS189459_2660 [Bacilli bacterium]GHU52246.1 hypothetical protein FACS189496_2070 [Bacilli bacterium]
MNKLDAKKINNMKVRTYSALYIVGIMSLVIILSFFASWSYSSLIIGSSIGAHIVSIIAQGLLILLFCGFLYLCLKEIFDCFVKTYNKKHFIIFYIFSVITLLIINICLIFYSYYKYEYIKLSYFLLLMLYSSISSLILSLAFKIIKKEYKINFLFILTVIFINFAINCIIYISITRWFSTILLLIVVTACFDAGAYFCGSFFGKHKIAPIISPNKT